MSDRDCLSRRDLLRLSGVGSLLWIVGRTPAAAQTTRRTPTQVLGPFYPVVKPLDQDADLTVIAGRPGRAAGQVVEVTGRIMTREGNPVAGARVEIWQANTHGRYTHPSDRNPAPLDPNFEGFAVLRSDAEGRYRFKTIKPGAYPEDSGVMRAPHIHFDVLGSTNRLVTQMYFAGEALNETDRFLATAAGNRERLIVPFRSSSETQADSSLVGVWDIVLDQG
jgi:protocatechuate 3,4-dioxygenase, beta subunit